MAGIPVAIIMGSQSDWATMRHAAETLDGLGVAYDARIVSAHRTPDRLVAFAKGARAEGFQVVIAGAGGAAHLPGMAAAPTPLPVFGAAVGAQRVWRRGRRRGAPAGAGGGPHAAPGLGGAGGVEGALGPGQPALHRADARRHPGR